MQLPKWVQWKDRVKEVHFVGETVLSKEEILGGRSRPVGGPAGGAGRMRSWAACRRRPCGTVLALRGRRRCWEQAQRPWSV